MPDDTGTSFDDDRIRENDDEGERIPPLPAATAPLFGIVLVRLLVFARTTVSLCTFGQLGTTVMVWMIGNSVLFGLWVAVFMVGSARGKAADRNLMLFAIYRFASFLVSLWFVTDMKENVRTLDAQCVPLLAMLHFPTCVLSCIALLLLLRKML